MTGAAVKSGTWRVLRGDRNALVPTAVTGQFRSRGEALLTARTLKLKDANPGNEYYVQRTDTFDNPRRVQLNGGLIPGQ